MSNPLVSVILPTHNRADLLRRAVESVLAQTYEYFELIVVDDCSQDHTQEAMQEIDDERVRYIRLDRGHKAAAARNIGIEAARGEFIAFQDDDDLWLDFKLQEQLEHLLKQAPNVGLSISSYKRDFGSYQDEVRGHQRFKAMDFRRGPLSGFALIATPGWLVRRACILQSGGFDSQMQSWDDWELAYRLNKVCDFIHFDKPTYVQNRSTGGDMWKKRHVFASDLRHIMQKHGADWADDAKTMAHFQQLFARYEAEFGSMTLARQALFESVRLQPLRFRVWLLMAMSLMGQPLFVRLSQCWRQAKRPLDHAS